MSCSASAMAGVRRHRPLVTDLVKGRRAFLLYDEGEGLWHERYLAEKVELSSWVVISPTLDVYVEDLLHDEVECVAAGPRDGVPRTLTGKSVFRFNEKEFSKNLPTLAKEAAELAEQSRPRLPAPVGVPAPPVGALGDKGDDLGGQKVRAADTLPTPRCGPLAPPSTPLRRCKWCRRPASTRCSRCACPLCDDCVRRPQPSGTILCPACLFVSAVGLLDTFELGNAKGHGKDDARVLPSKRATGPGKARNFREAVESFDCG